MTMTEKNSPFENWVAWNRISRLCQDHPFWTVAIAFSVGVLAAPLFQKWERYKTANPWVQEYIDLVSWRNRSSTASTVGKGQPPQGMAGATTDQDEVMDCSRGRSEALQNRRRKR